MLYTYPSNRLENLVEVLHTLLQVPQTSVLAADVVLVQHPGMQHWLNMELAKKPTRGISMNMQFPLPVRFFWDLIRAILGEHRVPKRSQYSREILTWRIYHLLQQPELSNDALMAEPTAYWQKQRTHLQANRRYQLAEQVADLYEQYLMYRPEWINDWETKPAEHWQAKLWQALVAQQPEHPLGLMKEAIAKLQTPAHPLPAHFYVFGINALAPIWLNFLHQVAEQTATDIHVLYLNPSDDYWGDIVSEKQAAKQRAQWINLEEHYEDDASTLEPSNHFEVGNPLLASLGKQGQTFVRLLSEKAHFETAAFGDPGNATMLRQLQSDILQLQDTRESPIPYSDDSIVVSQAHSAFREVQGLHDWLLHQFNNDTTLTPKDVLVMCPNVEDYAPFVQAVFAQSFAHISESLPPLPCSVADRNLKQADATVAAFLELLSLPDARFEVSQILSWLRVPAIAAKFELSAAQLATLQHWLADANVHWGLNAAHKQQWVEGEQSDHFTWQQGLQRLILGYAYGDENTFVNQAYLLANVEGSDALLLGRLHAILQQLRSTRSALTKGRTPIDWQQFFTDQLRLALFAEQADFERSHASIVKAVNDFTEYANAAGLEETELPLTVVRSVLESAFSSPEQTGSQFMTGQITVCSMVPMRSIPFRVVAILGLNDGEFPRVRPPLGFDLMAKKPPKAGDRSRRGDDRYLFLEALLSARDNLYLSYQGFDIKKNEKRPPSLVLEELLDYLSKAYQFGEQQKHTLALQPYSKKNYTGRYPSFDPHWLAMQQRTPSQQSTLEALKDLPSAWQLADWVRFFHHPAKYYAQMRLGLYLEHQAMRETEDDEPFILNQLQRYQFQQQVITSKLAQQPDLNFIAQQKAASALPLHAFVEPEIEQWQQQAERFADWLLSHNADHVEWQTLHYEGEGFTLQGAVPFSSPGQLLHWRLADFKARDLSQFWLSHLLANSQASTESLGFYRDKGGNIKQVYCDALTKDDAKQQLNTLYQQLVAGLNQPLLLNSDFALAALDDKFNESKYHGLWANSFNQSGLAYDVYIARYWQSPPPFETQMALIQALYGTLLPATTITTLKLEGSNDD